MLEYAFSMVSAAILIGSMFQAGRELFGIRWGAWLPLAGLPIACLPIAGLPIGRWIFSFLGNPSLPLLAISAAYCWRPLREWSPPAVKSLKQTWIALSVLSLLYYPLALGWTSFDPHAWGWSPHFIWLLMVPAAVLFLISELRLAGLLVLTAICWQLDVLQNPNGWSYLIDPISMVCSVGGVVATLSSRLLSRKNAARDNLEADSSVRTARFKQCA